LILADKWDVPAVEECLAIVYDLVLRNHLAFPNQNQSPTVGLKVNPVMNLVILSYG
jgi:hypothetical protein